MKQKSFLLLGMFLLAAVFSMAQTSPYRVVFDLTSGDTTDQKTLIRWLKGITASNPEARLEVVLYGQSLNMVDKDRSVVREAMTELSGNNHISFKVCEQSLKRHKLDKSQLLPGVTLVPDGIFEIIQKQGEGWGYIKVTH